MSDKPQRLVCQRAIDSAVVVPGTRFDLKCHHCDVHVGVAPSGQGVIADHPDIELICQVCFNPKHDDEFFAAPGVIEELLKLKRGKA